MADEMNTDERAKHLDEAFDCARAALLLCPDREAVRAVLETLRTRVDQEPLNTASAGSDGVASLSAAEPADDAIFEFWWADHMPNATQSEAWAEWCALRSNQPAEPAPTLTQGAAIAAGAVNKIPMPDSDDPGKALLRTTRGWDFCRNGNMIRSLDEFEIGFVEAALRASHGQAPAQAATAWHAPGLGEVHNEAHDQMIFCADGDDVADDTLAKQVCAALNATPSPQAAQQAPAVATAWEYSKIEARIKELMAGTAHPNSTSVAQAMKQLVNELWQEYGQLAAPAAPSTPASGGWMPIETAPKDGRLILVHFGCKGVRAVSWDSPFHDEVTEENGIWCVDDDKHGPYGLRGYNDEGPSAPTHWREMPASPTIEGESNG